MKSLSDRIRVIQESAVTKKDRHGEIDKDPDSEEMTVDSIMEASGKFLLWEKMSTDVRRDFVKKFRSGMLGIMSAMDIVVSSAKEIGAKPEDMLAMDDAKEIQGFISRFKDKVYFKSRV